MSNVAVNLVATMMQNNFSGKTYQLPNSKGLTHSNFSSILKQTSISSAASHASERSNEVNESVNRKEVEENSTDTATDTSKKQYQLKQKNSHSLDKQNNNQVNKREQDPQNVRKNVKSSDQVDTKDPVEEVNNELSEQEESEVTSTSVLSTEKVSSENTETTLDETELKLVDDIADALGLSPDELTNMLNQMQMNIYDLFNPANFKAFMQEALGVDNAMDLLVSESALEKLQSVVDILEQTAIEVERNQGNGKLKQVLDATSDKTPDEESQNLTIRLMNSMNTEALSQGTSSSGNNLSGGAMASASTGNLNGQSISENLDSTFQGILNQVVTQKTETIVMNGTVATIYKEVTAKDVMDQIVTGMKVQVNEGNSKIVLQLNPENLGKIALSISHEKGEVTGQFVAESEAVKKIIESNLNQLKTQLQNQGINVNELKIVVGDSASFFADEQDKGNSKDNSEAKKSRRISNISNISSRFADTILEENLKTESEFIHENSSIELHA